MKYLGVLMIAMSLSLIAKADSEAKQIEEMMTDETIGASMNSAEIKGKYAGVCFDGNKTSIETLYVGTFENANGVTADMAISTAQVYGGYEMPKHFAFLLQPSKQSEKFMKTLVKQGLSGTDNNLGKVEAGSDFKFLYSATTTDTTLTVGVSQVSSCPANTVCNPPRLASCNYGHQQGVYVYEGCLRHNDQTVFKKISDDTLISHRTAKSVGERTNNFSFYLPAISTFCKWEKI